MSAAAQGTLIDIIAGARPNFMKIAPIIRAVEERQRAGSDLPAEADHTAVAQWVAARGHRPGTSGALA